MELGCMFLDAYCICYSHALLCLASCCVLWTTAPGVYAIVRCENHTVRTRVFKEERNPEFNLRAIFHRRYPDTHISVEVKKRFTSLLSHTHTQWGDTINPTLHLSRAVMEQRSAVGHASRWSWTQDQTVREESEPRGESTRWPVTFSTPGVHLCWDIL